MGYYLVVANKIAHSFSFSSNEIMYFTFIHRPTVVHSSSINGVVHSSAARFCTYMAPQSRIHNNVINFAINKARSTSSSEYPTQINKYHACSRRAALIRIFAWKNKILLNIYIVIHIILYIRARLPELYLLCHVRACLNGSRPAHMIPK